MWRCTCGTDVPNGCSHSCGGSFIPSNPSPHPWGPPGVPNPLQAVVASLQRQVDGLGRECARLQDKADQWDAAQPMIEAMTGVVVAAQAAIDDGIVADYDMADAPLRIALRKISDLTGAFPQKGSDDAC